MLQYARTSHLLNMLEGNIDKQLEKEVSILVSILVLIRSLRYYNNKVFGYFTLSFNSIYETILV